MEEEDPSQPRFGRQKDAVVPVHELSWKENCVLSLDEEALLRSQGGPLASIPVTSLPTL